MISTSRRSESSKSSGRMREVGRGFAGRRSESSKSSKSSGRMKEVGGVGRGMFSAELVSAVVKRHRLSYPFGG